MYELKKSIEEKTAEGRCSKKVDLNMGEVGEILCKLSRLTKKEQMATKKAYCDLYSQKFSDKRLPDFSKTAMWRLFNAVSKAVLMNGKTISLSEEDVIKRSLDLGYSCIMAKRAYCFYNNTVEYTSLKKSVSKYSGAFSKEITQVMMEIETLYYRNKKMEA